MRDKSVGVRPLRTPQDNVPQTRKQRELILEVIRRYVAQIEPVPPLSLDELRQHTDAVMQQLALDEKYRDFATILLNNETWRSTVRAIPYEKRLLLLPKCLRHAKECPAYIDEVGLLCEHCGRCVIDEFKRQAEQLGYAVLIAEGSPVVMSLIETGQIEGVVGVSCIATLEKVFPYMEAGAVPGIAIPLLRDGCANTFLDTEWLWEAIHQTERDAARRMNLDALKDKVSQWFTRECLETVLGKPTGRTEQIALDWMAKAGKRWRPFLTACVYEALARPGATQTDDVLRKAAVAIECFHKASLIHDDIEDDDAQRYGQETLHEQCGVPIALNVGDLLLGEGYRLLIELDVPDAIRAKILSMAVHGHRTLCLGQGSELSWKAQPGPLSVEQVLEIFRQKTSPAFEVALSVGAALAGADDDVIEVLRSYSEALGTAYQIHDDLEDLQSPDRADLLGHRVPSILLAMAYEYGDSDGKASLEKAWNRPESEVEWEVMEQLIVSLDIEARACTLMESYKSQAIGALIPLKNIELKSLLRRVLGKIFNDFEIMGCCNDLTARHAKGSEQSRRSSD